jgi:murein DD-endopeptidase MepM/ murein hydrolase activator NlpD
VRLFPATARHRLVAVCAALAVSLGVLSVPLAHADDVKHLKHQQAQAQHSIKHAQADLDESSAQTRRAFAALTSSRAALHQARHELQVARDHVHVARRQLHKAQRQLQRARARLAAARAKLAEGQQAVATQHTKLVNTVTSLYEQGDPQLIGFLSLLNAQTPADLTRQNEANNVVLGSQDQALDSLKAAEVLFQVREAQEAKAKELVVRKRQQAAANLVLKRQYKQQAVHAKARVARTVHDRKHAWAQARRARAHDKAKLARSKRQEADIHRRILAELRRERLRALRHHNKGGYEGSTNGLLLHPVNGPITSPYGWRIHPIYGYWGLHDGDDFGAPCGAPLFAVANGTVMSEYYSDVWGNRLYINLGLINGKNVTVIYNHLSAYRSTVGEHESPGQVVGLVGTTGWSTGCHTHFTVMVNGVAVDPAPWFGH